MTRPSLKQYDLRSAATLISTSGVLPLPFIALVSPGMIKPAGLTPMLIVWAFTAVLVLFTLRIRRLSDGMFAAMGFCGMIGIGTASFVVADPGASAAVLCLVAVIPTISAISSSPTMTSAMTAGAVAIAIGLSVYSAPSSAALLIRIGALIGVVVIPVFLVAAMRRSLENSLARERGLTGVDPLTGLYNRRGLISRVAPLLAAARVANGQIGVLLMDIDHFKAINDRHGHLAGDRVLTSGALAIRENSPLGSVACRFGGEEFVLFTIVQNEHQLLAHAESLREAIATSAGVTISIGGVCATMIPSTSSEGVTAGGLVSHVINAADRCVYWCKQNGRDRSRIESIEPIVIRPDEAPVSSWTTITRGSRLFRQAS